MTLIRLYNFYELILVLCIFCWSLNFSHSCSTLPMVFCVTFSYLRLLVHPCGSICLLPMFGIICPFPKSSVNCQLFVIGIFGIQAFTKMKAYTTKTSFLIVFLYHYHFLFSLYSGHFGSYCLWPYLSHLWQLPLYCLSWAFLFSLFSSFLFFIFTHAVQFFSNYLYHQFVITVWSKMVPKPIKDHIILFGQVI